MEKVFTITGILVWSIAIGYACFITIKWSLIILYATWFRINCAMWFKYYIRNETVDTELLRSGYKSGSTNPGFTPYVRKWHLKWRLRNINRA